MQRELLNANMTQLCFVVLVENFISDAESRNTDTSALAQQIRQGIIFPSMDKYLAGRLIERKNSTVVLCPPSTSLACFNQLWFLNTVHTLNFVPPRASQEL